MDLSKNEFYFDRWNESERIATRMMPIISNLRLERGVLLHVYGRSIARVNSTDILKVHRHARLVLGRLLRDGRLLSKRTQDLRLRHCLGLRHVHSFQHQWTAVKL